MSKISGLKKGDIVRIRFKEMRDIVGTKKISKRNNKSYAMISEWDLGANILAFTYGGDFLVKDDSPSLGKAQVITLLNHLDGGEFEVPEEIVESLEVVDAAQRFISEEHKLAIILNDNDIYINGEKLSNDGDDKHLDKFTNLIERYLANKIINSSLGSRDA